MPIRIAMPVAHVTGAANYGGYYFGGNCVFRAADYFNVNNCEGIRLEGDPAAPTTLADSIWDLYAFTDGFLSFQNNSLILRLALELTEAASNIYNSGKLFKNLEPKGPQLRRVVYRFDVAPATVISDNIRAILSDVTHPGRTITRVFSTGSVDPVTLGNFIGADPANLDLVALDFMAGSIELFVRAGDKIGTFKDLPVQLSLLDSCVVPGTNPAPPSGRPLSPSYFLYLIRSTANSARVRMLTGLASATPDPPNTTHPLYFLLDPARLTAANLNANLGVNLTATTPPPPLHLRVTVQNAASANIAGYGIPIRELGEWHESSNNPGPVTEAPVRWRLYGNKAGDTNADDFGRFITEVKQGREDRLPGASAFDHRFTPVATLHTLNFQEYWSRYQSIFNRISEAFELPIELLVATACTETSTGDWYSGTFANSHEMDVIRMEPVTWKIGKDDAVPTIDQVAAQITNDAGKQTRLSDYMNLAGLRVFRKGVDKAVGSPGPNGANANIPVPWAPNANVALGGALSWDSLSRLIGDSEKKVRDNVKVSPGVMQTLVGTAHEALTWGASFYGTGFVHALAIDHNGVTLAADNPSATSDALFSTWFGVGVNAAGTGTTPVDAELTKMKRAMHSIIAGALHIKRRYNTIEGSSNMITDLDLPTSFSGFNDGAQKAAPAKPGSTDIEKWHRLFALTYYDDNYPNHAPRFYNAAVNYFNTTANLNPLPAIRLWKG